jgi:hypothetical protein
VGDGYLPLDCRGRVTTAADERVCRAEETLGGRAYLRMAVRVASPKALGMPTVGARLRTVAGNIRNPHLPRHDPYHGQAVGIISDLVRLFKHPLIKFLNLTIILRGGSI